MFILNRGVNFSIVNPGKLCYKLEFNKSGAYDDDNAVFDACINFNLIELSGNIIEQKSDIKKFIERVVKINDKCHFNVIIDGKDSKINLGNKVSYFVFVEKDYEYEAKHIQWFIQYPAIFIFNINSESDFEYVSDFEAIFELKKEQTYCKLIGITENFISIIKFNRYNILLNGVE